VSGLVTVPLGLGLASLGLSLGGLGPLFLSQTLDAVVDGDQLAHKSQVLVPKGTLKMEINQTKYF